MKYTAFKDQKIAYYDTGTKGPAVVLLHGFCEDSTMWVDFMEGLDEHFRIIRIDFPGHGQSEIKNYLSIADMAEAVAVVTGQIELKKFVLIGHSMGGYISLEYAKKYANRLTGLGLFHSHPFADSNEKKTARNDSIEFIENYGHEFFVKKLIPKLFKGGFAKSHTILIDKLVFRASRFPAEGFINALKAMAQRNDNSEVLKTINVPVLMIIGKLDGTLDPEEMIKQAPMPTLGKVHLLENVGHMGMFSAEKETRKIVKSFLKFCEEKTLGI